MAKKKIGTSGASTGLAPITDTAVVPILGSPNALSKLPGDGGAISTEQGVTLVTGRPYSTREQTIPASEIYFVDDIKPHEDGPWLGEADKVAWRDPTNGYECIMLRDSTEAFLSGYVGVPRDHPLWGFEHQAVPLDLGIEVHGGLTYSHICADDPSPLRNIVVDARRICHVTFRPLRHAGDYRLEDPHAWWFGFNCNHIYDLLPGGRNDRQRFLAAETAAVYRDDAYVVREVQNLAAQLRAIADGTSAVPREGPPLPPVGLDPKRGG